MAEMKSVVTAKQLLQRALDELPEEVTIDEAVERLYLVLKVRRGLTEIEEGKGISQEEVEQSVEKWLE